ncbi:MAG: tRNA (N6-threonylcarbamoyladenosine(37)-N6)-methyltransferase TrmO [Mogibacterium sp.]|nr:tRNA (N6-threonylcarbamoyladenosine(37)-N6)-methyltransferase TrmO [Mogibacterium sp.]
MHNSDKYTIRPIARIRSDYNEKFGVPRQSGLVTELEQAVVIEPEFSNTDALRGLEEFTYIWLIWGFSENAVDMEAAPVKWSPTVRPPRLGGKVRKGVWATRSPYRPNSLGLSSVRLKRIETDGELRLIVTGADLVNGTPVYDIKPYIAYSDSHPDAAGGFTDKTPFARLEVTIPEELLGRIDQDKQDGLIQMLELDPRGAYEKQPGYIYGLSFSKWDIRFRVDGDQLTVVDIISADDAGDEKAK